MNRSEENLNQKISYILIADKLINSGNALDDAAMLGMPEIISRNMPLIKAFPEIFGDCTRVLDYANDLDIKKIITDLSSAGVAELLHIPGRLHEARLSASSRRKKQGAYYTPAYIIRYMIAISLKYLFETERDIYLNRLKIIDPACGGGAFLLETFNALVEKGLSEEEAIKCIFGTDIDKDAVNTAIFVLTLSVIVRNRSLNPSYVKQLWQQQVIAGNALNPVMPPSAANENNVPENFVNWPACFPSVFSTDFPGFDIVVGNPPYISNKLIPPVNKKVYKSGFNTALGQYDLSVLFFEQGINLLKQGGVVSYITSNKFMAADYGKNLRHRMIDSCQICEMVDVSTLKCFKNTAVYPVIISFRKTQPGMDFEVRLYKSESWDELESQKPVIVNQGFFKGNREHILTTQLTDSIIPIIQKIENAGARIPEEKIRCGLAETGFNKWVTECRQFDKEDQDKFHPFIQSGNIESFKIKDRNLIDKTKFKSERWLNIKGPKLVIPGISKDMKAAVDFSDSLLGRVYFVSRHDVKYDLGYLAVILNSFVLNFYYKVMYWPVHLEGGYLRFNSTYLANLPIYSNEQADGEKAFLIEAITGLGSTLISDRIEGVELTDLKNRAEALTFLLYGISIEEITVIMDFLKVPSEVRDRVFSYYYVEGKEAETMKERKIDSKLVYSGKVLDLKLDKVELPNGKEANREVVVHPGAVTIAAVTENNEIILIRQFRYPAGDTLWELPAGKLERGEDPLACAKRELSEETGYGASEWSLLSTFFTTPGFSDEIMYLYLARGLYNEKLEADDDEFIELHHIPYIDAVKLINQGEVKDAKTIVGILLAGQKI